MSCKPIRMKDGTVVLVDVKPGEELTDEEARVLEQYIQFCRDRRERRKRGAKLKEEARGS